MRPRLLAWILLPALLCGLALFAGCGSTKHQDPWGGTPKKRVLTSIIPMYCFAATIAGGDAEVRCLMTTTGPHDFQPSIFDAKLLGSADLFIVNGLGLEEFLDGLIRTAGNDHLKVCRAADRIAKEHLLTTPGLTHYHGDKLVSHPAGNDPHVWLGIDTANDQIDAICDALVEIDPPHAASFQTNAKSLKAKLDKLKSDAGDLKTKAAGGLVTFHDSFRYFCHSFDIPLAGTIRGLKGEDISPAELTKQANEYREKKVRLISIEPQYPHKVAESLREAINRPDVKLVELDPLETGPCAEDNAYVADKNYYLSTMKQNVDNLRRALEQ
jgi:zinc transport system substrate-binding protein